MSILRKYPKTFLALVILAIMIAISYSWTFTPHGRLDYRAAVSLRLLSFERTMQPDPDIDFEVKLPVNLVYALSFALPKEDMQEMTDIFIPGQDAEIPARIYRPIVGAAQAASLPVQRHGWRDSGVTLLVLRWRAARVREVFAQVTDRALV